MQNKPFTKSALLSRRAALSSVGVGLALLPGMRLLAGCSASDAAEDADTGADGGSDSATGGTGASGGKSATANGGESASGGRSATAIAWATGGTAAMTAVASYPDPFAATSDGCALTQGPCWAPSAPLRQDISEGEPGLPLRLALRLVQAADCSPVVGAEVEVWHCDVEGEYSAHDVENVAFCTGNDPTAIEAYFFRGRAISDAQGKVVFDGCFPGWYASRAVHIHLVARLADHAGESTTADAVLITQLFFPEDLTAEIFTRVAGYSDRGQPDTTLATDTVIGSLTDTTPYLLDYEKMDDGAMLAWKTIAISETESCGSSSNAAPGGQPSGTPGSGGMGHA